MRTFLAFVVFTTACAAAHGPDAVDTRTVRERLADSTRLVIGTDGSTGTITASRYTHDGWVSGTTPLVITNGELVGKTDASGQLAIDSFAVGFGPIDIPESVFGKPAQLKDVRVTLGAKPTAQTTWMDDDDATATAMLDLDLAWTIVVDGNAAPLGTQHLPPVPVDVALTGAGDHVDTSVSLHATGDLWSWAGLLKLTDIQLQLAGATVDGL